jgi:hypothetical protein
MPVLVMMEQPKKPQIPTDTMDQLVLESVLHLEDVCHVK